MQIFLLQSCSFWGHNCKLTPSRAQQKNESEQALKDNFCSLLLIVLWETMFVCEYDYVHSSLLFTAAKSIKQISTCLLTNIRLVKIRSKKGHNLLKGLYEVCVFSPPTLTHLDATQHARSPCNAFGQTIRHRTFPQKFTEWIRVSRKSRSEGHTSLRVVNDFQSILSTIITWLWWN